MNIKELHESVEWKAINDGIGIGACYEHPDAGLIKFYVYERVDKRGFDFELRVGPKAKLLDAQRHNSFREAVMAVYGTAVTYMECCQDSPFPSAESMLEAMRGLEFS